MDGLEMRLTAVEQRCKSNGHRLEQVEKQQEAIHSLAASLQVMASEQKHQTEAINTVREDVSRLDGKVDALEMKPARRWDGLVEKLVWGVVGAVLAALLSRAGL
ncbi:MAG: hypothetical protein IJA56_07915 [Clostridia bacterium]|nr:hypothetical protein [Clostridia bacterium]